MIVDGLETGRIRGLWVLGENAAMTDPDLDHVHHCLAAAEFLVPFHFVEAAANVLTHAALDPVAKIPEYKVCAVAVEPVRR